jgi:hypothetical protein
MAEVCRQLCIPQDTPSYVHHCLGACERSDEKVCYPMLTKTAITGLVFYQARNQDNVSQWGDMSVRGLLFQ